MNIQEALRVAAVNAWSGFSVDNTTFGSADCATMLEELNKAVLFLTGQEDFPKQIDTISFNTVIGQRAYQLSDIRKIENIYLTDGSDYLKLIDESPFLDIVQGKPTQFYPKYIDNVLSVYLHRIPDAVYEANVNYQKYKFILAADDSTKELFTAADDELNIPEHLQELFWRCLFERAMQTNNKDETDENYKPIILEANEFWNTFVRKTKIVKRDGVMTF